MNLKRWVLGILLLILVSLPVVSIAVWFFSPTYPINLMTVDKTVLTPEGNEHRSLNWILKHNKFVKPNGDFYELDDYRGFFPLDSQKFYIDDLDLYNEEQLDSITDTLDMVYFTDTYGIYYNEWYRKKNETEHSEIVYGRTSENDFELMKKMHEKQKLIITEFNTIASPTNISVRKKMEDEFGVRWSGWVGRYFFSLDTNKNPELPKWVVRLYKEQYGNEWPFKTSGIVFVHESEEIVVLDNASDLLHEVPIINTDRYYQDFFGVSEYIRYPFWFDITHLEYDDLIVSTYKIHTNLRGDSILKAHSIPKEFPAVLGDHIINRFYYFAGDFCDNPIAFSAVYSSGIEYLDFFLYNNQDLSDRKKFFWTYYRPLMTKILYDYHGVINFDFGDDYGTDENTESISFSEPE